MPSMWWDGEEDVSQGEHICLENGLGPRAGEQWRQQAEHYHLHCSLGEKKTTEPGKVAGVDGGQDVGCKAWLGSSRRQTKQ